MNLNEGLDIPAKDIPSLEGAALGGSGGSALRLALFHRFIRHDWVQYSYWITISAENNDPVGTYDLAYLLVYGRDVKPGRGHKNALRARFWLQRSAEQGNEHAKEALREPGKWGL
jgi:TPR repeat protein